MRCTEEFRFTQPSEAPAFLAIPSPSADVVDWCNHSSALFVSGQTDLALIAARRALSLARTPETLLNLSVILESQSRFHSAFSLSEEAYSLAPTNRTVACHYSDALLRLGDFSRAWPIYSASHANWDGMRILLPEWDGRTSLKGKRILALSGGGYGDDILFLRWLPRLAALGATVTLLCPVSLQPLLARVSYIHHFLTGSVSGFSGTLRSRDYDLFTSLRSLAGHFCPTPADIPPPPYLRATDAESPFRREGLRQCAARLIGLCTRAGEESFPRRHRTLSDAQRLRILRTPVPSGTQFVELNHGGTISTADLLRPPMRNWGDTATLLSALDLVITVDTGVAHLAGALGVPSWIMLPGMSAAYYGIRGSSPFYPSPSHRLFRNFAEGIDRSVTLVCEALERPPNEQGNPERV